MPVLVEGQLHVMLSYFPGIHVAVEWHGELAHRSTFKNVNIQRNHIRGIIDAENCGFVLDL